MQLEIRSLDMELLMVTISSIISVTIPFRLCNQLIVEFQRITNYAKWQKWQIFQKRHFECLCRFVIVSLLKFMNSHRWLMCSRLSLFHFCPFFTLSGDLINGSCHFTKINTLFHGGKTSENHLNTHFVCDKATFGWKWIMEAEAVHSFVRFEGRIFNFLSDFGLYQQTN